MKLSKKTIAVSTASLVLMGGISAFAYVTLDGSGSGTGEVSGADASESLTLGATLTTAQLNALIDGPATTTTAPINAALASDANHTYSVLLDAASSTGAGAALTIDVTGADNNSGCAALLSATSAPTSSTRVQVAPGASDIAVGTLTVSISDAPANDCFGGTVTVSGLASH
jgi:hypothetical protein